MTPDRHLEFNNLVEITASNLNILPGLVLKDYWVTRILRTFATDSELSKNIIFKGGKCEPVRDGHLCLYLDGCVLSSFLTSAASFPTTFASV
jgi:hypothetical protein